VHPPVEKERLPDGYTGPISGYQERVNRFFEKKSRMKEEAMRKPNGIP
jgi:hypothetical protein